MSRLVSSPTVPSAIEASKVRRRMSGASFGRFLQPAVIAPVIVFVAVVAAWQAGAFHALFDLRTFTVPYPSAIADGAAEHGDAMLKALGATLPAALVGYACGMVVGFAMATLLVRFWPGAIAYLLPALSATNSLPIVALAPLIALFVGPGMLLKVIVVTIMTAPTMLVYAVRGLTNAEPTALELMASIEATPGQVFRLVRVPTALPFVFTALRSSVVLALIGTIVSEAVRGFEGLGHVIVQSMGRFDAPRAWLALVAIAAIGITWYVLIGALERVVLPWELSQRRRE